MIKFFRKIRYNLMEQNKTGKYLKYAIGEIILVMVGILLALQVNNWNDRRIKKIDKSMMLNSLVIEFEANLNQIKKVMRMHNLVEKSCLSALELINEGINEIDEDSLIKIDKGIGVNWTFDPINGALRSSISSGNIHLINNKKLSTLLFEWEDLVGDLVEDELNQRLFVSSKREIMRQYVPQRIQIAEIYDDVETTNFPADYKGLYENLVFENFLSQRINGIRNVLKESSTVKKRNVEIIEELNNELENY